MPVPTSQQSRVFLLLSTAVLCSIEATRGQIAVGPLGYPANPFTNTPPVSEWATRDTFVGDAATYRLPEELDAVAQTFDQSTINVALFSTVANSTSRYARHNTAAAYLVTQPGGVPMAVLKATLRNISGFDIDSLTVSYDYSRPIVWGPDFCPGHRVFYSLTGTPDSWILITNFSGITNAGTLFATLELGAWPAGSDLFILWLDDNSEFGGDGAHALDNFAVSDVVPSVPTPLVITNLPASLKVDERAPATFSVGVDGFPRRYHWFSNDVEVAGNNQATFTIPSVSYPENNGMQIYVVVSNALTVVTSTPLAVLTVTPDITAPAIINAVGNLNPMSVTVNVSEPINIATAGLGTATVFISGTDPDDGLLTTGYFLTNNNQTIVFTTEPREYGRNYSIRITGILDASSQQNALVADPTFIRLAQTIQLIGFDTNNVWKWDLNSGDLFGTGWETVGYDDSAWLSGPAGLGLDASANGIPIRTTLPYALNSAPTFFRRHFFLPSDTNAVTLMLRHVIEDGAVYYINGQEAARFRVAPATLTFNSRAAVGAPDPTPIEGPFMLPTTNLVSGDNVIAVVVLQFGATSADMEFAAELTATVDEFLMRLRIVPGPANGQITIFRDAAGKLQQTDQLSTGFSRWTDVPGNPNPYVFTITPGTNRFFSLRP